MSFRHDFVIGNAPLEQEIIKGESKQVNNDTSKGLIDLNTEILQRSIEQAETVSEALQLVDQVGTLIPVSVLLSRMMQTRELTPQRLADLIEVERSTLYRLLSGERLTTRNVLLRIAIVMSLTVEETQTILRAGQRAQLYALVRRDAIILFGINRRFSLAQIESILLEKGENSLFERL